MRNLLIVAVAFSLTSSLTRADDFERGLDALKKGNCEVAIKCFSEHLSKNPIDANAYAYRGMAFLSMRDDKGFVLKESCDKAHSDASESLKVDSDCAMAFVCRGAANLLKVNGDLLIYSNHDKDLLAPAMKDIDHAIHLDPKLAPAFVYRGNVWRAFLEREKANADYDEAIRLDSGWVLNFMSRGAFFVGNSGPLNDGFEKATKDFTEAIRLNPKLYDAYYARGRAFNVTEQLDKSLDDFLEATKLRPDSDARAKVRYTYVTMARKYEDAVKLYQALACYSDALKNASGRDQDKQSVAAEIERLTAKVRETWAKPNIKVVSIDLDLELKPIVVKKSSPIQLAPNTEKIVEDTIRIRHSTSVTDTLNAGVEVRGKITAWFAEAEAAIRLGIEKSINRTFGVETETKRSVTIKASPSSAGVRVVWVELYRTGKAKVELDGEILELPFEFKEDFDLLTEAVDTPKLPK